MTAQELMDELKKIPAKKRKTMHVRYWEPINKEESMLYSINKVDSTNEHWILLKSSAFM